MGQGRAHPPGGWGSSMGAPCPWEAVPGLCLPVVQQHSLPSPWRGSWWAWEAHFPLPSSWSPARSDHLASFPPTSRQAAPWGSVGCLCFQQAHPVFFLVDKPQPTRICVAAPCPPRAAPPLHAGFPAASSLGRSRWKSCLSESKHMHVAFSLPPSLSLLSPALPPSVSLRRRGQLLPCSSQSAWCWAWLQPCRGWECVRWGERASLAA